MDRQQIQIRWNEIVNAMVAAGVPRDELSLLAIVAGAELLFARNERMVVRDHRPIGFSPAARKEDR